MASEQKHTPAINQDVSGDDNIVVGGDVKGFVISGNDNTVNNQTIIQKVFNFFRDNEESLDRRNRKILLNHMENFWIKGVLEKSLSGAPLMMLRIKEKSGAVKNYPWLMKNDGTNETLPEDMAMLDIFEQISLGRSLLILGASGSGKTTMLIDLTRQLIARARQDVSEPIPIIFNLTSWTESKNLAEWLSQQLNLVYYIPKKIAPNWLSKNKLFLLLDGLDEVRLEIRSRCVDAINAFCREHSLTSVVVCSRTQDYVDIQSQLAFVNAIEIQPLMPEEVESYIDLLGKSKAGIKLLLKKNTTFQKLAETPLFLHIMIWGHQGIGDLDNHILAEMDEERKQLFTTYIMYMLQHSTNAKFTDAQVLQWLSWLAYKMIKTNQEQFFIENIQPRWLIQKTQLISYGRIIALLNSLFGTLGGLWFGSLLGSLFSVYGVLIFGVIGGIIGGIIEGFWDGFDDWFNENIQTVDSLTWTWIGAKQLISLTCLISFVPLPLLLLIFIYGGEAYGPQNIAILFSSLLILMSLGVGSKKVSQIIYPGEKLFLSIKNFLIISLSFGFVFGVIIWTFSIATSKFYIEIAISEVISKAIILVSTQSMSVLSGLFWGSIFGLLIGLNFGGTTAIHHYALRFVMYKNNLLPWRLVPFLEYCARLNFLYRVGGGYIFIHRLLMEHFAAMYEENVASKN